MNQAYKAKFVYKKLACSQSRLPATFSLTFPLRKYFFHDFKCLNLDAKKLEYSQINLNLQNNKATDFSVNDLAII